MDFMEFLNMVFNMLGYTLGIIVLPVTVYYLVLKYGEKVFRKVFKKK